MLIQAIPPHKAQLAQEVTEQVSKFPADKIKVCPPGTERYMLYCETDEDDDGTFQTRLKRTEDYDMDLSRKGRMLADMKPDKAGEGNHRLGFILDAVAGYFGVSRSTLLQRTRGTTVMEARAFGMVLSYNYTRASKAEIGRYYDRDHTAIQKAIDGVNALRAKSASADRDYKLLADYLEHNGYLKEIR